MKHKLFANVGLPEMNHNELVGWESGDEECVVVLVRMPDDHVRTKLRMDITTKIFQNQGADVIEVEPDGPNRWALLTWFGWAIVSRFWQSGRMRTPWTFGS